MKTQNVAKVKESMNALVELKTSTTADLEAVLKSLAAILKQLEVILDEEEDEYAEGHKQKKDVVVIYDEKLNALFEAIGILDKRVNGAEQVSKTIDAATDLLKIVTQ